MEAIEVGSQVSLGTQVHDGTYIRDRAGEIGSFCCLYDEGQELRLTRGTCGEVHSWHLFPARPVGVSISFGAAVLVIESSDSSHQPINRRIMAIYLWPDADLGAVAPALDQLVDQMAAAAAAESSERDELVRRAHRALVEGDQGTAARLLAVAQRLPNDSYGQSND